MKSLVLLALLVVSATAASYDFEDDRFEMVRGSGSSESSSSHLGSSYSSSLGSSFGSSMSASSHSSAPVPPFSSHSQSSHSSHHQSSHSHSSHDSMEDEFKNELIQNMQMVATDDDSHKDTELQEALQSVKDNIVFKANQVKSEKRWVREVTKIVESYVTKARRVNAHIRNLQKEVKILFRKKKQIENMIVQRKLEQKLRAATKDLQTIGGALQNIQKKETAFKGSKTQIKETIGAMVDELKKLRGSKRSESSSSSSGSSSSSHSSESSSSL